MKYPVADCQTCGQPFVQLRRGAQRERRCRACVSTWRAAAPQRKEQDGLAKQSASRGGVALSVIARGKTWPELVAEYIWGTPDASDVVAVRAFLDAAGR